MTLTLDARLANVLRDSFTLSALDEFHVEEEFGDCSDICPDQRGQIMF